MGEVWDFEELTFESVTADFGRRRALTRVSFVCRAGTITGLIGPNGAGKTTLLTIAASRGRPSSGWVRFGTGVMKGSRALRGRIGWLGHDPGLYPELTARENLAFFAELHGVRAVDARVAAALDDAGLSDRADDPVGSFSRGMRQRIGLERVLLHDPRLVLLDEPFTGLDEASSRTLMARLVTLRARGCIVLLSTHDLDRAERVLDRAIVLRDGRLVGELADATGLAQQVRDVLDAAGKREPPAAVDRADLPASVPRSAGDTSSFATMIRQFGAAAALIARKDLVVELRSRELLLTTLFFALSTVLVFAFAFVKDGQPLGDASAGILWVSLMFSGTLSLARTFDREHAHQTLAALLQAPIDRAAIYVGKLAGLTCLSALVLAAIVPVTGLLFQAAVFAHPWHLLASMATGTLGFLAVGSLFAAMLVRTRSRDVLLPVLLYPMTVPVLLAGVRGTAALLQEPMDAASWQLWLTMLIFFDLVFVTLALWTFDAVTSD